VFRFLIHLQDFMVERCYWRL